MLAAANTYTGGTTIAEGTLLLTNANAAQNTSINVSVDNGLQFAGGGTFNIGALGGAGDLVLVDTGGNAITAITGGNSTTTTYAGEISGPGTLVHGGSGVLVLAGSNSFSGGLVLAEDLPGGGVVASSQANLGTGPITFTGNNTLGLSTNMTASNSVAINSGVTAFIDTLGNTVTWTGLFSGGGTLNKIDSGTLVLANSNTFSGLASVSQGTLALDNANAAANGTVSLGTGNGLQFSTGSGTFNIGGLSGSGALSLADTGGNPITLTVGGNNQNSTFSGALSGSGSLVKAGSGSLDLTGSSNWTGGLVDDPGIIAFASDAALGSPSNPIAFVGSGTLQAGGSITLSASRNISISPGATATFNPSGNSLTIGGVISGSGVLALAAGGTLVLSGTNTFSGGTNVAEGTLIAASNKALANGSNLTIGDGEIFAADSASALPPSHGADMVSAPVPEPSATGLLIVGSLFAAAVAIRLRRIPGAGLHGLRGSN